MRVCLLAQSLNLKKSQQRDVFDSESLMTTTNKVGCVFIVCVVMSVELKLELRNLQFTNKWMYANTLHPFLSLLLSRCWWRRLLPASLPALPGYRSDQFGWHCPLLFCGWCPLYSLSGLLQKCRLLLWPDTAWDISHPALVHCRLIAATVCQQIGVPGFITVGASSPVIIVFRR